MTTENAFDILKERGFIYQTTDEEELRSLVEREKITCYVGFDPTADSLHVGHLLPIMSLVHMQRNGHRPLAIVGGGTGMVGDPSDRTEMRRMMTVEEINANVEALKKQLSRYISFEDGGALLLNNADWLKELKYIDFLRDIGRHFSVNRMLAAESYKQRMEKGLSFIEFNYMILQAYDFHILARDYDCRVQMGGQDQWGNIVAGADLVRRIQAKETYGTTFPLLTNASGEKFGKTVAGAVWLDEARTPPYDFYQFWRNTDDRDLGRFLGLFTFLPMEEVVYLGGLAGDLINRAKEVLAYEATKITHGKEKASEAYLAALKQFGPSDPGGEVKTSSDITEVTSGQVESPPSVSLERNELNEGMSVIDLFVLSGLSGGKGEAKRLIRGGGAYVNDERVGSEEREINLNDLKDGVITLRAGKKRYRSVVVN